MDSLITASEALPHISTGWPADRSSNLPPLLHKFYNDELQVPLPWHLPGGMNSTRRQPR
jgi:hypothetical protein